MDKYIKKRLMVMHPIDYKYRIHALLKTMCDDEIEKIILGSLLMELNLSYAQLRTKLDARIGQSGMGYTFSITEMHIILNVINRFRPFRKQVNLAQLYHPDIRIGK